MGTENTETYTENLHLIKPGLDDNYDIRKINDNMDTLDTVIKALQDAVTSIQSSITSINGNITTIQGNVTALTTRVTTLEDNAITFVKTGEY